MTRSGKWYVATIWLITLVNDGWSGRPSLLQHQLLLLPFLFAFTIASAALLTAPTRVPDESTAERIALYGGWLGLIALSELMAVTGFDYEARHFARFGYAISGTSWILVGSVLVLGLAWIAWLRSAASVIGAALLAYSAGLILAIRSFPLNYLRSDMLPVIVWADMRLVHHLDPYGTMHVGGRIYDFPYLPGMLVAYVVAVASHTDVRVVTLVCVVLLASLVFGAARRGKRMPVAVLLSAFLLSPFLQYRHELYLAPHWLALVGAIVFLQRRKPMWSAAAFGIGMTLYQLNWVLFPFFLLYAWRRGGVRETARTALVSVAAMLVVVGPFLRSAMGRIASNTVGQWSRLPHALADPINLSFWATYLLRPDQLKWLQLFLMTAIFAWCVVRDRCGTLTDMLRWMSAALAIFIALNVLVDGYFYLTLSLLFLMYTCAADDLWSEPYGQTGLGRYGEDPRPAGVGR